MPFNIESRNQYPPLPTMNISNSDEITDKKKAESGKYRTGISIFVVFSTIKKRMIYKLFFVKSCWEHKQFQGQTKINGEKARNIRKNIIDHSNYRLQCDTYAKYTY